MSLTRKTAKYVGATAATIMAGIYFLIGLGVLDIGGSSSGEMVDLRMFGFSAGTAFLALGVLLFFTDWRWIWVLALLFQVFVYLVYVATSGGREPPFEIWGITLRILQLPVLASLIYLSIKAPQHRATAREQGEAT
jgi:hypothetical protein